MKQICIFLLSLTFVSCGSGNGGDNPVAPTPTFPQVAGTYSGLATVAFPELGESGSCPASTTVTQNGGTVNVAPIVLGGECGSLSVPMGGGQINNAGAFPGTQNATMRVECGTYTYSVSGGFFSREFRISALFTSASCYNMNMTINMSR